MTTYARDAMHAEAHRHSLWSASIARRPHVLKRDGLKRTVLAAVLLASPVAATPTLAEPQPSAQRPADTGPAAAIAQPATGTGLTDAAAMARFLDRLMLAESGGRDDAKNPRSTALGPFQFIESTFLEVVRRHLAFETVGLTPGQILLKRTDRAFSRLAAEAYTRDNAATLAAAGLETTFANLRLAFLAGSGGAIRVLKADPATLAITALGANVVQANPFMAGMTTADLAAWSARNLSASDLAKSQATPSPASDGSPRVAGILPAAARQRPVKPAITVNCDRGLASCRRWIALATRRAQPATQVVARKAMRNIPR